MITTGVTGRRWRASVTAWGAIEPWGDQPTLNWYVAADDRWHVPADESAVRQRRIDGTAVTETRVRVPTGDVVQRIASVADAGGMTVVEITNESTLPVAVAFDRSDVSTERPIADVPIEGIDLPAGSFVMPLGHGTSARIALAHGERRTDRLPASLPSVAQVVRGWLTLTERASRLVLPDGATGAALAEAVTAERCEIALGALPTGSDDAAAFVVALGELVRLGERPDPWLPELVDAVEQLAPVRGWEADVALEAAARVLAVADECRAGRDLARITSGRTGSPRPAEPPAGPFLVPWVESGLASGGALLPDGLPDDWLGQSLDVYGVPTGPASTVSFALRWHGARPAVLWEQTGPPVTLTSPAVAPGWTTDSAAGEALWPAPEGVDLAAPLGASPAPLAPASADPPQPTGPNGPTGSTGSTGATEPADDPGSFS